MTVQISATRQKYIKQARGRQLVRSLRRKFKTNDFKFKWAPEGTSTAYWDGTTMFIRYDVENLNPAITYTTSERFIIQAGLAYHEMGHKLYDDMSVYRQMIEDHSSSSEDDWILNLKWPRNIVSDISNFGADGRLEHFIKLDYPFTAEAIDYVNYEWCFVENTKAGSSKVDDFFACLLRRLLQLFDETEYVEEAKQLVDDNQALIDNIIRQRSTKDNLTATYELLREVWPVIYEWIQDEKKDPESYTTNMRTLNETSDYEPSQSDIEANLDRVMDILNSMSEQQVETPENENEQPQERSKPNFDGVKEIARNEAARVDEQVDDQLEANRQKNHSVAISTHCGNYNTSAQVIESQVKNLDVETFGYMYDENRLKVKGLSKALRLLLQPVADEEYVSSKGKRIKTNLIWRATQCNDNKIFRQKVYGKPAGNVYIGCMTDVSGSTSFPMGQGNDKCVIDQMKEALTVVLSAAEENQKRISTEAFAFETDWDDNTTIYQLKDSNKFTIRTKGAIGGLRPGKGNRDVVALQYLIDKANKHDKAIKLAVMLSDGAPCFVGDEGTDLMKEMIAKAKKQGIDVVCLFVGDDEYGYNISKQIYGNNVVHSEHQLVKDFKNVILRIIKIRRG